MDPQTYLRKHSEELSRKYPGKYIAVVDGQVVAADLSPLTAFNNAKGKAAGKEIGIFYMATDEEMVTPLVL